MSWPLTDRPATLAGPGDLSRPPWDVAAWPTRKAAPVPDLLNDDGLPCDGHCEHPRAYSADEVVAMFRAEIPPDMPGWARDLLFSDAPPDRILAALGVGHAEFMTCPRCGGRRSADPSHGCRGCEYNALPWWVRWRTWVSYRWAHYVRRVI